MEKCESQPCIVVLEGKTLVRVHTHGAYTAVYKACVAP